MSTDSFHSISRGAPHPGAPALPDTTRPGPGRGLPVLRLGFRPFYLLAAAFATVSIPAWLLRVSGMPLGQIGLSWHMHEMVFGFALAVIIGFLYTAGRNWTGLWTPHGAHLGALAALWVAGRIRMLTGPTALAAAIDLAFLPLAAWPLYKVLAQAGNKRNLFLVGLLALLFVLNALFHAGALGWIELSATHVIASSILVIVMIESVMGARVIPMFTANAVPGVRPVSNAKRDRIITGFVFATAAGWMLDVPAPALAGLAAGAGVSVATRALGYAPHRTLAQPLVWILHLSYAWIAGGFILLAASAIGLAPSSAAFHALGVGATGGLIIGMITRTARGHTGRPLRAGRAETAMFLLLQAGAFCRVLASLQWMDLYQPLLVASGIFWSAAFGLYVVVYGPWLMSPRVDGREG